MKKVFKVLAGFSAGMLICACATTEPEDKTEESKMEEKVEVVEKESTLPFGLEAERYAELLDSSLVSMGNNARMKKVLEKLRAGQDVYIAAIGGSVTEGGGPANFKDGYAYQFNKKLREVYTPDGGKHVYFDNAGLSGTGSEQGMLRYESDVVQVLDHKPDLLIVEFAVNDDGKDFGTRSFEVVIRRALEQSEETAVIALYSAAEYGNSMGAKKPVADFYEVAQVNVLATVQRASAAGDIKKNLYYTDNVHPTTAGHTVQADCLMNLIEHMDKAPADAPVAVPTEWKTLPQKAFTNFTRILPEVNDSNVKITAGGFSSVDPKCQGLKKTGKSNFPTNWHHDGKSDEAFTMEITCKSLMLIYKEQAAADPFKFGKAEFYVDGNLVQTYNGGNPGGWNNCVPRLLIDETEVAKHTVQIKMVQEDEAKGFTVIAMGYTK